MSYSANTTVTMPLEEFHQMQQQIAEKNFSNGVKRGERNILFYLQEILSGNLEVSSIDTMTWEHEQRITLYNLCDVLKKAKGKK